MTDDALQSYDEKENFYKTQFHKNPGIVSGVNAPQQNDKLEQTREKNLGNQVRGGTLPNQKTNRRQDIMENFRMRVLRNLDLAVDIIHDEGNIILKKYDDLRFYLKKIANGKIYTYKANQ